MGEDFAIMLVFVTLILTAGGVAIIRPLSKRLAELLHVMTQERLSPGHKHEIEQVRDLLTSLEGRLSLLEERQNFAESLLETGVRRSELPDGVPPALPQPANELRRSTADRR